MMMAIKRLWLYNHPNMSVTEEKEPLESRPTPEELIREVDNKDLELLMAYSRYLERPNEKRRTALSVTTNNLLDSVGPLLRDTIHGELSKGPNIAVLMSTLLNDMAQKHSRLLADYMSILVLPSTEAAESERLGLEETLEDALEEGKEQFVDAALEYTKTLLESDMEGIEFHFDTQGEPFASKLGEGAIKHGLDIAKIGAGSATGLFIWDLILKR